MQLRYLIFLLAISSCRDPQPTQKKHETSITKHEDFFITRAGDYKLQSNTHSISVYNSSNGMLNIRTVEPNSNLTWEKGWIDANKNWFIYVDKVNEVWLNYGDNLSFIYSFESGSGIHSVNHYPHAKFKDSELINIIPKKVIQKLSSSTITQIKMQNKSQ